MRQDDDPEPEAIYDVGTVASVLQLLKLPDGTVKVLVEGLSRADYRALPADRWSISRPKRPSGRAGDDAPRSSAGALSRND